MIRIQQPRAVGGSLKKRAKRGYRKATGYALSPIQAGITAAIVGLTESSGLMSKLPEIPLIGRKGAVAIGAWYWSKHGGGKLARDVAIVSAVLAGYEFGKEGKISGEDYPEAAAYESEV